MSIACNHLQPRWSFHNQSAPSVSIAAATAIAIITSYHNPHLTMSTSPTSSILTTLINIASRKVLHNTLHYPHPHHLAECFAFSMPSSEDRWPMRASHPGDKPNSAMKSTDHGRMSLPPQASSEFERPLRVSGCSVCDHRRIEYTLLVRYHRCTRRTTAPRQTGCAWFDAHRRMRTTAYKNASKPAVLRCQLSVSRSISKRSSLRSHALQSGRQSLPSSSLRTSSR